MKKIRKICLNDNQVMKNEEMGQVFGGDDWKLVDSWTGCNCQKIADCDDHFWTYQRRKIDVGAVVDGTKTIVGDSGEIVGGTVANPALGVGIAVYNYYEMVGALNQIIDGFSAKETYTIYQRQTCIFANPIRHITSSPVRIDAPC